MAGLWVTVCLPPAAAADVEGALERALAPFFTDTSDNPPDRGMWNSRRIRGGSDGMGFAVATGHEDDPRLLHDDPWYDGTPCPSVFGLCAGGPRALLDFSDPLAASRRAVAASWDLWHRLAAVHPPHVPLHDFVERWTNDPDAFPDDRWGDALFTAYRAQPLVTAYLDHPHSLGGGRLGFPGPAEHPVIGYDGDREDYVRERTYPYGRDTDVLTPDGWWRESDGTALHASCDPGLCPHDPPGPAVWPGSEAYLAALPGETLLVRLRCHA
ncbi:hypothetical protein [Streptomyces sp. NPDC090112]|uniref:hypothetical protein n=1 Tax=Streptomyces sp. NPDC090112 TaxID=3365949 RepID=UPI00382EFF4A